MTWLSLLWVLWLIPGFGLWYLSYGLECFMDGATLSRDQFLAPFQCFWEEVLWVLPGGRKRKGDYIRRQVSRFEGEGYMGSWTYSDIRRFNLYEEVGSAMLPGWIHFVFMHVFLPLTPMVTAMAVYEVFLKGFFP